MTRLSSYCTVTALKILLVIALSGISLRAEAYTPFTLHTHSYSFHDRKYSTGINYTPTIPKNKSFLRAAG